MLPSLFPTATCLLSCLILASSTSAINEDSSRHSHDSLKYNDDVSPQIIAGYLPDYRSNMDIDSASLYLSHLILFSVAPKADGTFYGTCCLDSSHFEKARNAREFKNKILREMSSDEIKIKKYHPAALRLVITIGGAGRSDHFSVVTSSRISRNRFIKQLIKLVKRHDLDGIDYDWEVPTSQIEVRNYHSLIRETYEELRQVNQQQESDRKILISMTVHPNHIMEPEYYQYVDYIHMMTYDMMPSNMPFHHARFDMVTEWARRLIGEKGRCPSRKIILGIPAYGRHKINHNEVKTYSEIIDQYIDSTTSNNEGQTTLRDIDDIDSYADFSFDSPSNVRRKMSWSIENDLGGVFFWEIGQDKHITSNDSPSTKGWTDSVLLKAAASAYVDKSIIASHDILSDEL